VEITETKSALAMMLMFRENKRVGRVVMGRGKAKAKGKMFESFPDVCSFFMKFSCALLVESCKKGRFPYFYTLYARLLLHGILINGDSKF
jgi:hypothetical protein